MDRLARGTVGGTRGTARTVLGTVHLCRAPVPSARAERGGLPPRAQRQVWDRSTPEGDHKKRVEQVVAALEQPSLDAATTQRARSVIQTRNAKPMREKLRDVVSATGARGEEIADWAPDFVQNLTQTCNKVSHGSATPQHVLSAEERHWHGQVLLWVMRVRLLQERGCADAGLRALENRSFQFALEQLIGERP
ncbi:HEPN domain-containing protein [Streptomyces collinus]|uniref:HEPN domain-containing protein n=1 Tax=Streptomyces collinus TaxID=42684 RepID=UPI0036BB2B02